jgi:hypothetical protein
MHYVYILESLTVPVRSFLASYSAARPATCS